MTTLTLTLTDRDYYEKLKDDWNFLPDFLDYFENQAIDARRELKMEGSIEFNSKNLPQITERRFSQLQILNATIEYFEKHLKQKESELYRQYLENYKRALTSRDVDRYIQGEPEIVSLSLLINEISLMRNVFVSISKGIDAKSYQINNITRLRAAGLDDASIN